MNDNLEEAQKDKESSEAYYANRYQRNVSSLQWGVKMDKANQIRMETSQAMGESFSQSVTYCDPQLIHNILYFCHRH